MPHNVPRRLLSFNLRLWRHLSLKGATVILLASILLTTVAIQAVNFTQQIPPPTEFSSDIQIGLRVNELDLSEADSLHLEGWKRNYIFSSNLPLVTLTLNYILISDQFVLENNIKHVCFIDFYIVNQDVEEPTQDLLSDETCMEYGLTYIPGQSNDIAALLYDPYKSDYTNTFYYPFDKRSVSFNIIIKTRFLDHNNNNLELSPDVRIFVTSGNSEDLWSLYPINDGESGFDLRLSRPLIYQILLIMVSLIVLLLMIHLNRINRRDSFWEITVGIFLGLWGIHDVLIPVSINSRTLVSSVILFLYLILTLFIIVEHFVKSWE